MTEDWPAVSRAITRRMTELGLSQRELISRSQVSKAIVGELQNNTAQRRRSSRTLEALSIALDWHPDHLTAVLGGHTIPEVGQPRLARSDDDVQGRLAAIEHQLGRIADKLGQLDGVQTQLDDIHAQVEKVAGSISRNERRDSRG